MSAKSTKDKSAASSRTIEKKTKSKNKKGTATQDELPAPVASDDRQGEGNETSHQHATASTGVNPGLSSTLTVTTASKATAHPIRPVSQTSANSARPANADEIQASLPPSSHLSLDLPPPSAMTRPLSQLSILRPPSPLSPPSFINPFDEEMMIQDAHRDPDIAMESDIDMGTDDGQFSQKRRRSSSPPDERMSKRPSPNVTPVPSFNETLAQLEHAQRAVVSLPRATEGTPIFVNDLNETEQEEARATGYLDPLVIELERQVNDKAFQLTRESGEIIVAQLISAAEDTHSRGNWDKSGRTVSDWAGIIAMKAAGTATDSTQSCPMPEDSPMLDVSRSSLTTPSKAHTSDAEELPSPPASTKGEGEKRKAKAKAKDNAKGKDKAKGKGKVKAVAAAWSTVGDKDAHGDDEVSGLQTSAMHPRPRTRAMDKKAATASTASTSSASVQSKQQDKPADAVSAPMGKSTAPVQRKAGKGAKPDIAQAAPASRKIAAMKPKSHNPINGVTAETFGGQRSVTIHGPMSLPGSLPDITPSSTVHPSRCPRPAQHSPADEDI